MQTDKTLNEPTGAAPLDASVRVDYSDIADDMASLLIDLANGEPGYIYDEWVRDLALRAKKLLRGHGP